MSCVIIYAYTLYQEHTITATSGGQNLTNKYSITENIMCLSFITGCLHLLMHE